MVPTLRPGDEIVATDSRRSGIGDIVVFPHPYRSDFWMVKRRARPPQPIPADHIWAESDNPDGTDSRVLGAIPNEEVLTMVTRLDPEVFQEACELLIGEDPAFGRLVGRHGTPELWLRPTGFPTLVLLILEQQVSLESAAAVHRRLLDLAGEIDPERILDLGAEGIMVAGVTRQKAGYIFDLAVLVTSGALDLAGLAQQPPGAARDSLLAVRGIGPWTADVYLLAALGHLDSFPVGDRALQLGVAETMGLEHLPTPDELQILAEPWRPLRAVAARLIWHGYLAARGRAEPLNPTPAI